MKRRLAAIMVADIVGYSRLMAQDELGTLTALKQIYTKLFDPAVTKHRGRVVKLMGDGALVEFVSAVDAVDCAVAIQRAMEARDDRSDIKLRIGINVGDVIVQGNDLYGDGVNVAARLEGLAEPGGFCIAGTVREYLLGKSHHSFEDMGQQSVKNIDRPLRVWKWLNGSVGVAEEPPVARKHEPLSPPDKPSIAVLPFDNLSGDASQEHFVDGLTDDIIIGLSRISTFYVIARNSSFTYKHQPKHAQQISKELGVRYLIEGSVRSSSERVRVSAQLVDATTGRQIWSETVDREMSDPLSMQERIARIVVASVQTQVLLYEGLLSAQKTTDKQRVSDLLNRAWEEAYKLTRAGLARGRDLALEARAMDEDEPRVHVMFALLHFHEAYLGYAERVAESKTMAREEGQRAILLAPNDEYAHWILGAAYLNLGEHDRAMAELSRAIEINPNCSLAHGTMGTALAWAGRADEAIDKAEAALRYNPSDPANFFRYLGLAISYFDLAQYDKALVNAEHVIQRKPDWFLGHAVKIASLSLLDREEDAANAAAESRQFTPRIAEERIAELPFKKRDVHATLTGALRSSGFFAA